MKKLTIFLLGVLMSSTIFEGCTHRASTNEFLLGVLNNQQPFINESNHHIYLTDYRLKENKDVEITPQKYALIDFDHDGANELVVYVSPDFGAYILFHVYEGSVYGFEFSERAMIDLKADGTFIQSEGAEMTAYSTLNFDKHTYNLFENAYANDMDNVYRINGKTSTSQQLNRYRQEFEKKDRVNWQEISC